MDHMTDPEQKQAILDQGIEIYKRKGS